MTATPDLQVDLERLEPDSVPRVLLTLSCRDTDVLPKVPGAGGVFERDGQSVQLMHNGLVIEEGCYYGPWMTEIIKGLHGHHEPQEEVVFDAMLRRLAAERGESGTAEPVIVEFGSFWAYYSMWFLASLPGSRAIAMEPDPAYLEIGRRNAALNDLTDRVQFVHGAVGAQPGRETEFMAESSRSPVTVVQYDLATLLAEGGTNRVDVAMIDIQGYETVLLDRARDMLKAGAVRFAIVSTHHWLMSGDHLSHQKTREILIECGAHVIAEHSIAESFSGDGLIAVSFDPRDADLSVDVSRANPADSVFGEPERDLAAFAGYIADRDATIAHCERHIAHIEAQLVAAQAEIEELQSRLLATREESDGRVRDSEPSHADATTAASESVAAELTAAKASLGALEAELDAIHATKLWRWSAGPRRLFGRLRKL